MTTLNMEKVENLIDIIKDKLKKNKNLKITVNGIDFNFYNDRGTFMVDYDYNPDKSAPDDFSAIAPDKDITDSADTKQAKLEFKSWVESMLKDEDVFNKVFNDINYTNNRQKPTKDFTDFVDNALYQYKNKMILIYRKKDNKLENILNKKELFAEDKAKEWLKNGELKYLVLTEKELKDYFKDVVEKKNKSESLNPVCESANIKRTYDYTFFINEQGDIYIDAVDYDWSYVLKKFLTYPTAIDDFMEKKIYGSLPLTIAYDVKKREHIEGYPDARVTEFESYDENAMDMGYFTVEMTFYPIEKEPETPTLDSFNSDIEIPF